MIKPFIEGVEEASSLAVVSADQTNQGTGSAECTPSASSRVSLRPSAGPTPPTTRHCIRDRKTAMLGPSHPLSVSAAVAVDDALLLLLLLLYIAAARPAHPV